VRRAASTHGAEVIGGNTVATLASNVEEMCQLPGQMLISFTNELAVILKKF
jgi:hypothetical protein